MTEAQKKLAAKQFVKDWTGHGDEKQETQRFWMALLQKVFGVEEPERPLNLKSGSNWSIPALLMVISRIPMF